MKRTTVLGTLGVFAAIACASAGTRAVNVCELQHNNDYLWNDTIGFGSGHPNYGSPDTVAFYNGVPLRYGYDYNYLEHVFYLGDKPVIFNPTVLLDTADLKTNKLTLTYGTRKQTIDFGRKDAMDVLEAFCGAPKGWRTDAATYSFDDVFERSDDEEDASLRSSMPMDVRIIVSYPESPALMKSYFNALNCFEDQESGKIKIDDFQSFVNQSAKLDLKNNARYVVATPNRRCYPMEGCNVTIHYFPEYVKGDYVTIGTTVNQTYPAGGCRSSQTDYCTYNMAKGREMNFDDVFKNQYASQINDIYLKTVSELLFKDGVCGQEEDGRFVRPHTNEEIEDILRNARYLAEDAKIEDYRNVALCEDGFIFSYDLSELGDFGEGTTVSFFIPAETLVRYCKK